MESIEVPNTAKVVKFVFKDVDVDIENYSTMELEQFILDLKPNSPKTIITICYVLGLYAKWLQEQGITNNDNFYQMVQSLDKKLLWKKAKPNAKKKFISYEQYQRVIKDIATYEEFNALYYELLFSCIYNGIYNDDLSVIKNLKKSDIDDNGIILLHEDNGHSYKIKVSERLAKDLKQLADINIWERRNRFGICKVDMRGAYNDSVFKIENRSTASNDSFRFTFYAKLRKIAKEYLEYSLLPLHLYASGIMQRIKVELDKNGISLEEAFADNNRNKVAHMIIQKELIRCNSSIELGNFRELIKGHIDSFK
jgi:integrase